MYNNLSMYCDHSKQIGDTYGISCQRCGAVLEGYGYGGFCGKTLSGAEKCLHQAWYPVNEREEECIYCHEHRSQSTKRL